MYLLKTRKETSSNRCTAMKDEKIAISVAKTLLCRAQVVDLASLRYVFLQTRKSSFTRVWTKISAMAAADSLGLMCSSRPQF